MKHQIAGTNDATTTIQELKDAFLSFRTERGWNNTTPRNLAVSIVVEAAELIEHFQWNEYNSNDKQAIADELADVISYCLSFAHALDIDVSSAFRNKLERIKKKYPVALFNPQHNDEKTYRDIRQSYRQKD